jgi:hypothetical protein
MEPLAIVDTIQSVMSPMIQYGFAGMSFVLLAVLWWTIRRLLDVLSRNTAVIEESSRTSAEVLRVVSQFREELMRRPCLALDHTMHEQLLKMVREKEEVSNV